MVCVLGCLLLLTYSALTAATDYWYSVPKEYDTMWMKCQSGTCKGDNASIVEAEGPDFAAYVYYELGEPFYDKRVIFTSYIQPMDDGCDDPEDCSGRKGNNEFDIVETGYVGFNNTWFIEDNSRCLSKACGGKEKCWANGKAGCSWVWGGGPATCKSGDYNNCNVQKDPDHMPAACTWTDVQNGLGMCFQSAKLNPMQQDFTQLSANAYLQGETGPTPYGCAGPACNGYVWNMKPAGAVKQVNNRRSFSVGTGDGMKWGNRWIRLELSLHGSEATFTYRFFEPGPMNNRKVSVKSVQSFTLASIQNKPVFKSNTPHYWIFSMWQYSYEFAVATQNVWNSMRHLHYHVVKDVTKDDTMHAIKEETDRLFEVAGPLQQAKSFKHRIFVPLMGVGAFCMVLAIIVAKRRLHSEDKRQIVVSEDEEE